MKRLLYLIPFLFALQLHASQTWYVRNDGGGRFDAARVTAGFTGKDVGCDGLGDAPYPGTGTNQHCAYDDYRFLFDDQTFGGKFWVISGSDTVILRGGPWRVGFDQGASPDDVWCPGGDGNAACTNPVIPAGTSDAHTKILGENFASCGTSTTTDKSKLTQIFGGFGLGEALALNGAQFVDIECIEITRHSDCITHGEPREPSSCNTDSSPISDFDSDGIGTGTGTHDLLLQDMWIHGHTDRGIIGPIGGLVTCLRCNIDTNGMAGWDFDDGGSTPSPNGIWNISYTTIQWSGCNQEYPFVDPIPVTSCYGQSNEGYGDGVGTPPGFCMNVSIDHSAFLFNVQDGLDLGHLSVVGPSGVCTLSITNSIAESNGGATFKWGAAPTNVVMINNLAKADCNRMGFPITGAPSSYNANLGDFCRSGDAFSFNMLNNGQALIGNNTFVSYESTSIDLQCNDGVTCSGSVVNYINNTFLGYGNPLYDYGGHSTPGGWCLTSCNGTTLPIGTINRLNNIYYQIRETCQSTEICLNPLLVDQPTGTGGTFTQDELDDFNYQPTNVSPAVLAGTTYTGQPTTDHFIVTYSSPLPIGAVEPAGVPIVSTPTASPTPGTYTSTQSVTLSTTTGGATICYRTDGVDPAATTPGTCDAGSTTYTGAISVSSTTTIKALGTLSGDTNSAVASFTYTITAPTVATPTASPVAGTYSSTQSVTLSTSTGGAAICYSIDGSTPTATTPGTCDGLTYSGPLTVATTTTIKAIGTLSGDLNSSVFSGLYTITIPVVATPTCSPVAGTYTSAQTVTCSTVTSGATICGTTDGSTPTSSPAGTCSNGTSGPFVISTTSTIKAIGTKSGDTDSSVFSGLYTINIPTPPSFTGRGIIVFRGNINIP